MISLTLIKLMLLDNVIGRLEYHKRVMWILRVSLKMWSLPRNVITNLLLKYESELLLVPSVYGVELAQLSLSQGSS